MAFLRWSEELEGSTITIEEEEIDGDTATVTYTITHEDGTERTETANLVKEDGEWKISPSK